MEIPELAPYDNNGVLSPPGVYYRRQFVMYDPEPFWGTVTIDKGAGRRDVRIMNSAPLRDDPPGFGDGFIGP